MAETTQVILCPYCGHVQATLEKCEECGGLFDTLSLRATQVCMGPWFIRDKKRPFRPGCSYEILKKQINSGKIKANSVVRGPTTRQFWSIARTVPGVAHLLGVCHQCQTQVKPTDTKCPACSAPFRDVQLRNEMGLFYTTEANAQAAQKAIEKEIAGGGVTPAQPVKQPPAPGTPGAPGAAGAAAAGAAAATPVPGAAVTPSPVAVTPPAGADAPKGGNEDLLDEVLGRVAKQTQGVKVNKGEFPATSPKAAPKPAKRNAPAARPVPQPAASSGSGLDFDPVDEEEEQDSRPARGPGLPVFALITVNVILVLTLIAGVILYAQKNNGNNGSTSGDGSNPTDSSNNPQPANPPSSSDQSAAPKSDSDDLVHDAYSKPAAKPAPITKEDRSNPLSPNYVPPGSKIKPDSGDSDTASTDQKPDAPAASDSSNSSSASDTAKPSTPAPAPKESPALVSTIEARRARAKFLEGQKKYPEALAVLKDIAKNTPLNKQPEDLDESIRRLEGLIATAKTGNFFKVD